MNMKKKSGNRLFPMLLLSVLLFQQCNKAETEQQSHQAQNNMPEEVNIDQLVNSPNKQVLSRQATVKLSTQSKVQILKAQGYIDFDKNRNQTVSARFSGRIEKLYVRYDLQYVKKGEKILDLYSPELNTFQEEHLFLLKSEGEKTLLEQSRQKLKLLGMTDFQISQLEKNKTFTKTITVYSPVEGYVLFNAETKSNADADVTQQTSMNMETKNNPNKNFASSNSQIREGMYINKGETIFSINDLQNVWAIVSISSESHSAITENSRVKIISELFPDKPLSGKITLLEKTYEENKQRFIRIRVVLPNTKGELKINSLITAEIPLEANEKFQIPASAIYRTGLNSFVWVKTGTTQKGTSIFQLRKVITGSITNGMTTVINGLSANDEVAMQAGYLTDSETFLNDK
jgi:membrane fusion protein, copper/silver efflux system